jgi:hypothetical protein
MALRFHLGFQNIKKNVPNPIGKRYKMQKTLSKEILVPLTSVALKIDIKAAKI